MRAASLVIWLMVFLVVYAEIKAQTTAQYRAFWVDTFNTSLNNHNDVLSVVNNVKLAKCNAVFVQVRRRADSWYFNSLEPMGDRTPFEPGFDPLADLIKESHANGIEVHAFVIIGAIWNSDPKTRLPENPRHVFNQHGFNQATGKLYEGRDNWLTRSLLPDDNNIAYGGHRLNGDFWIDLGHPDAASYTFSVLMHLVRNYDIDGLHLDRIRYPELLAQGQSAATGASIGYNSTSVARFQRRYLIPSNSPPPAPNDQRWAQWRRDQVTNFVRRVYLNALAIKPWVKISAALITYGSGPSNENDWENADCYWRVYQDWRAWTEEGILDCAIPMDYRRDHQTSQVGVFDSWMEWAKNHKYDRTVMIGVGGFINSIEGVIRQARRAVGPSAAGNWGSGVAFFSFAHTNVAVPGNSLATPSGQSTPARPFTELASALTTGKSADGTQDYEDKKVNPTAVFAESVPTPSFPWKRSPQVGHIMGVVKNRYGEVIDTGEVTMTRVDEGEKPVRGRLNVTTATDGNGFYGGVDLAPGRYRVTVMPVGEPPYISSCLVTVVEGAVSNFDIVIDRSTPREAAMNVSAAGYCGPAAATESIVAAFGSVLAKSSQAASTIPLPASLAGTTVKLKDSAGLERFAPLFFVSPGQVNYQVPRDAAKGIADVTITNSDGNMAQGILQIARVAPGIFSANADGRGVAAAVVLRIKEDGTKSYEPVAQFDPVQNKYVPRPIDLGPENEQVFLVLFGTGGRFRSSLTSVALKIGGVDTEVIYADRSADFVGLDQFNVRLPRTLIGRGDVDVVLFVDSYVANPVQINIKGVESAKDAK